MTQRIIKIKGCKTCKQVLVFLDRNDSGEEFVTVMAWHLHEGVKFIQQMEISCCKSDLDSLMNERVISDFSDTTANTFVNSMIF